MAHRYHVDDLGAATVGAVVELRGTEAHHAVRVARARVGESISVGDGTGRVVTGSFQSLDPVLVLVASVADVPAPTPRLGLVQALAKGDRDERAVQAATELGVDVVVPWQAERSVVQWRGERAARSLERWRTIATEASKLSLRAHTPTVLAPRTTGELAELGTDWRLLVLDPEAEPGIGSLDLDDRDLMLVVGPEGGIAPGELTSIAGERVQLGPSVLRTSTAGPAAIAALQVRLGRW